MNGEALMGDPIQDLLRSKPGETLLRAYAALTHQIDSARDKNHEADIRAERDLIHNEIIRRMGETP